MNRGNFRYLIEIWEEKEQKNQNGDFIYDDLGEKVLDYEKVKTFFANIETRIGGLLSGRPADTVMTTVTHKISYPYYNFPVLMPEKHIIKYNGKIFDINYSLNSDFKNEVLEVFVTEKTVR